MFNRRSLTQCVHVCDWMFPCTQNFVALLAVVCDGAHNKCYVIVEPRPNKVGYLLLMTMRECAMYLMVVGSPCVSVCGFVSPQTHCRSQNTHKLTSFWTYSHIEAYEWHAASVAAGVQCQTLSRPNPRRGELNDTHNQTTIKLPAKVHSPIFIYTKYIQSTKAHYIWLNHNAQSSPPASPQVASFMGRKQWLDATMQLNTFNQLH